MSFKFNHNGKQYWAKQMRVQTEVYLLAKKVLAEKVLVLNGKPEHDEVVAALTNP